MLKLLENPTQDTAAKLLSCFSADIYTAYALFPLLDTHSLDGVWIQADGENRPAALLVKPQNGYLRIAAGETADFTELRLFAAAFPECPIHASPAVLRKLGIAAQGKSSLLELKSLTAPAHRAKYVYDGFRPIYDLVVGTLPTPPDTLPAEAQETLYNEWLSRTARGVFGGFTRVTAVHTENGDLSATAFADILGGYAYLREVACAPAYRKQGYASACVRTLCADLQKDSIQHIFLTCTAENETFYQKSGFQKCADLELGFLKL